MRFKAKHFIAPIAVGLLYLSSAVFAESKDDAKAEASVETKVDQLLAGLTLEEKIGQLQLRDWGTYETEADIARAFDDVRAGRIGGFLNVAFNKLEPAAIEKLQRIAVQESRSKLPLLIGQDVIHGYKTIFPIPLGQAASWNRDTVELGARVAAKEASSVGIRWTFAPMIDISRDPRWGRIAETLGEDPYLAGELGAAMVKGFQTDDPSQPDALAATGKHFAAYGAAEAGRDYNTAYVPEGLLRDIYLPPFKSAIDAGMLSLMSSYSTLNGVPATGNKFLMKDVLRSEWKFDGLVVSDWNAVLEMLPHGVAKDAEQAAELAFNAGIDFEMHTDTYEKHLPALLESGQVSMAAIDQAVRHVLRVKVKLGLLEQPYPPVQKTSALLQKDALAAARAAARESFVLLQNNNNILPLNKKQRIALVGPLADAPHEQLGTWIYDGDKKDSHSLLPALQTYLGAANPAIYQPTLSYSRDYSTDKFEATLAAISSADVIVYVAGEESILSGEGHSRGDISLPGAQRKLLAELASTGKPLVMIIMAGRPIALENATQEADALLMAWHPGTMAGPALVDVLFGDYSPSGKLPLTWPIAEGQIPIYYNHLATGRPATTENYTRMDAIEQGVFQHAPGNSSNHLDYGHLPQYPFGFGLTYSQFSYDDLRLSAKSMPLNGDIKVSAKITNTGKYAATEIVQLYVRDKVASVARPVRELKDFTRIHLAPGKSKRVEFTLKASQLAFHNQALQSVVEPGEFDLWIAPHAQAGLLESFNVTP